MSAYRCTSQQSWACCTAWIVPCMRCPPLVRGCCVSVLRVPMFENAASYRHRTYSTIVRPTLWCSNRFRRILSKGVKKTLEKPEAANSHPTVRDDWLICLYCHPFTGREFIDSQFHPLHTTCGRHLFILNHIGLIQYAVETVSIDQWDTCPRLNIISSAKYYTPMAISAIPGSKKALTRDLETALVCAYGLQI